MARIFVSYRREDDSGHAGRLYDRLAAHFGEEQVFMDVDSLEPGVDFVDLIETTVGTVDAFIAVIGPEWITCTNAAGARRLDDAHDFVRLELRHALERGVRVIPVLVGGAQMPRPEDLPDDLKPLVRRNALIMTDTEWHAAVVRLVDALDRAGPGRVREQPDTAPATVPAARPAPVGRRNLLAPALAIVGLLVAGIAVAAVVTRTNSGENTAAGAETAFVTQEAETERVTVTETQAGETAAPPPEEARLSVAEGRALQDRSTAAMRRGNWSLALALARDALTALEGRDGTYEAYANFNVGNSLAHLGRCAEAGPYLDRRERLLGPHAAITQARRLCA